MFGICNKYLVLIAKQLQLKIIVFLKILKIKLEEIWDTCINFRSFYQIVANKQRLFLEDFAFALENEDKKSHQLNLMILY